MTFRYFYTFLREEPERPRGMFALNREGNRLDTLFYDHETGRWEHDPDVVGQAYFGEDYQDERREVDRQQAEEIARVWLNTELPSEQELMLISDKGERDAARRRRWKKALRLGF